MSARRWSASSGRPSPGPLLAWRISAGAPNWPCPPPGALRRGPSRAARPKASWVAGRTKRSARAKREAMATWSCTPAKVTTSVRWRSGRGAQARPLVAVAHEGEAQAPAPGQAGQKPGRRRIRAWPRLRTDRRITATMPDLRRVLVSWGRRQAEGSTALGRRCTPLHPPGPGEKPGRRGLTAEKRTGRRDQPKSRSASQKRGS